ncbi:uncharacterized protein LOC131952925 [Physella acuta]|uniref:uncharacterized protein LOC131952925 n=1 Tax=Physella acuta TaxID=109671 RepID=UPI0027DDC557|nr:uncharacterized protein LOC131952925 [Physella acuta]
MTQAKRMLKTNQKMSVPHCQPTEVTSLESFLIATESALDHTIFACFLVILAVVDSTLFVEYFKTYKLFNLTENVWITKTILGLLSIVAHLALVKKITRLVRRLFVIVTMGKDTRSIRDLRKDLATSLNDIPTLKLDDVIRRYAWQKLLEKSPEYERDYLLMHQNRLTCYINWKALTIEHGVPKFITKVKDGSVIKTRRGDVKPGTKWVTLLSCYYDNKAGSKQCHPFKGSRKTASWVDVDLEQCYTVNKQVCIKLNLSAVLMPLLPMAKDNNLNLKMDNPRFFLETHTWEVNSQVEVEPSSRAHAQLLARQECSVVEFEIGTTLSNPKGVFAVTFKFESRNTVHVVYLDNLLEAFHLEEAGGVLQPEERPFVELIEKKWLDKDGVEHVTYHPQIITRGSMVCLGWSEQKLDIKNSPLSMDESTTNGDNNMDKTLVGHTEEDTNASSFFVVN